MLANVRRSSLAVLATLMLWAAPTPSFAATIQLLSYQISTVGNAVANVTATGGVSISLAGDDLFSSATVVADYIISEPGGFGIGMSGVVYMSGGGSDSCYGLLADCPTFQGATLGVIRLSPDPALVFDVTPRRAGYSGDTFALELQRFESGTYRVIAELSQLGGGTAFSIHGGLSTTPIPEASSGIMFPIGLATVLAGFALCRPRSRA